MTEENPEIPVVSGFEILQEIGAGGFSRVHLARHVKTNTYCAVKIVNLAVLQSDEFIGIMREISVFMQVEHPNICALYNLTLHRDQLYFFMECAPKGTLLDLVNTKRGLQEPEAHKLFIQLYSALRYLHTHHFLVHRDLKLENVLIDSNGNVKLTDFGLSSTSYCNIMRTIVGTPGYQPPEILAGGNYDEKCDVWSLGVCLYAMMTDALPFNNKGNYRLLIEEAGRLQLPKNFSPALQDLLRKMLEVRNTNRMSLIQLQNHPWLRGLAQEKMNFQPRPIVFYKVPKFEDIAKFKRKSKKADQKILDKCVEIGFDAEALTNDLKDGLINDATTAYFCFMYPLNEKPTFEKPEAVKIAAEKKQPKKKSSDFLERLSQSKSPSGTLRNSAKQVVGPTKTRMRTSLSGNLKRKVGPI